MVPEIYNERVTLGIPEALGSSKGENVMNIRTASVCVCVCAFMYVCTQSGPVLLCLTAIKSIP